MRPRGRPELAVALLLTVSPAAAQVTVNPGALDLLPSQSGRPAPAARPTSPRSPAPAPASAARPAPHTPPAPAAPPSGSQPPAQTPAAGARPVIPTVPPAIAALPPPPPIPAPRIPVVVVPAIGADAPGTVAQQPNGLRITFGPDRQDLNAGTDAALRALARSVRAGMASVTVLAYAAGTPDDPSAARRLSLGRALTARAVLINEGVASSRIYPRALGATGGDTDPDRVDVTTGPPATPATPTGK